MDLDAMPPEVRVTRHRGTAASRHRGKAVAQHHIVADRVVADRDLVLARLGLGAYLLQDGIQNRHRERAAEVEEVVVRAALERMRVQTEELDSPRVEAREVAPRDVGKGWRQPDAVAAGVMGTAAAGAVPSLWRSRCPGPGREAAG